MPQFTIALKRTVVGIGLAAVLACPLTFAASVSSVSSQPLAQPIVHTPDIDPLEIEDEPGDILEDDLVLPDAFVEGDILVVDGKPYPIGDSFYNADGIPLGPHVADRAGLYGYAPIQSLPDHVLIWYLDGSLRKRYLIVTADDPLLQGPTGFNKMIENVQKAEDRLTASLGTGSAGVITAVILQLAVCPATAGTSCATAVATLAIGGGLALLGAIGLIAFDLIPALNNVERAFETVEINRP